MQLLVVNYHYIGPEDRYPYPGIFPTTLERFRTQLEILERYFEFVSQNDLIGAFYHGKNLPEKSCLITFDDGLRSQYEYALPILDEKNIPAIFFANGMPYKERRALLIHQIHYCRANLPAHEFMARFAEGYMQLAGKPFSLKDFPVPDTESREFHRYDAPEVAAFKHILNKLIEEDLKEAVIRPIFESLVPDQSAFLKEFYISEDGIRELGSRGYLGAHTLSHKSLSGLSSENAAREINEGRCVLEEIAGVPVHAISYPYGSNEEFSHKILEAVKAGKFLLGFTMERSLNRSLAEPLLIGRFDTNDVPGGKKPGIGWDGGMVAVGNPGFSDRRHLYFNETGD